MRKLAIALAIGGLACTRNTQVGPTDIATSQLHAAPPADSSALTRAWDVVATGTNDTATAGDWNVHRTKDGAIHVDRRIERVAGHETSDRGLDAAVHARLAEEKGLARRDMDLDVDQRIVTLHGMVRSAGDARRVVEVTLGTPGVDGVISYLHW
jgi:osmotically-inducible protein OsmY